MKRPPTVNKPSIRPSIFSEKIRLRGGKLTSQERLLGEGWLPDFFENLKIWIDNLKPERLYMWEKNTLRESLQNFHPCHLTFSPWKRLIHKSYLLHWKMKKKPKNPDLFCFKGSCFSVEVSFFLPAPNCFNGFLCWGPLVIFAAFLFNNQVVH